MPHALSGRRIIPPAAPSTGGSRRIGNDGPRARFIDEEGKIPAGHETEHGAAPTVLVADDDADILRLVSRRLSHRGYRILTAETGVEALAIALEHCPDAAVLDGIMPGLEGHEVCARMRDDERTSGVPVVLLTAKAADADHREALDSGADAYIVKPFRIEDLDSKLRELLSTSRQDRD